MLTNAWRYRFVLIRSHLAHKAVDLAEFLMPSGHSRGRLTGESYTAMSLLLSKTMNETAETVSKLKIALARKDLKSVLDAKAIEDLKNFMEELRKDKAYAYSDKLRDILQGKK